MKAKKAPKAESWGELTDEKAISQRRTDAEKELENLTGDQVAHLRRRCKNDLFFLANGPLEYDLLSTNFHGQLCNWMTNTKGYQYRIILLPRGHYKSTIDTIAESVQIALPNDAKTPEYPWSLGQNVKILIGHENRESASRFLYEIAAAFLEKPLMLALYPECVPSARKQRLNKWEVELPRTQHHKEPTFDTIGAGGAAQGRHYHHLKLDDLIGKEAKKSETVMKDIISWFNNVNSLLTRPKLDGWDLIGTRWSFVDLYGHAMETYGIAEKPSVVIEEGEFPPGLLAAYVQGYSTQETLLFPEEFPIEFLNILRKDREVWAAQYANNPKDSGLMEFQERWLKFYNVMAGGNVLAVFEGDGSRRVKVWDLDRAILVDPSVGENKSSDESGIIVTGTDSLNNVYILETVKEILSPPDLIDRILKLYTKWYPRLVSIEKVTFSAVYKYWLQSKTKELGIYPSFYDYVPGSKRSKDERIRGLTNYFASGQVYIMEGMYDFRDEYETFPLGKGKHLLDALAQGPEIWSPGLDQDTWDQYREAEREVQKMRSRTTGY